MSVTDWSMFNVHQLRKIIKHFNHHLITEGLYGKGYTKMDREELTDHIHKYLKIEGNKIKLKKDDPIEFVMDYPEKVAKKKSKKKVVQPKKESPHKLLDKKVIQPKKESPHELLDKILENKKNVEDKHNVDNVIKTMIYDLKKNETPEMKKTIRQNPYLQMLKYANIDSDIRK